MRQTAQYPARLHAQTPGSVDARIQIVWPHDETGHPATVESVPFLNVEAYLFQHESLLLVECAYPNGVVLHAYHDFSRLGYASPAGHTAIGGQRILKSENGRTFPAWVFNDVPVTFPNIPGILPGEGIKTYFVVSLEGADHRSNVWAHAADPRTILPQPRPADAVEPYESGPVDAFIQIAWPHDRQGQVRPVTEAPLVNLGVELAQHPATAGQGPLTSVDFSFDRLVRLLRSLNDGLLQPVKVADDIVAETRQRPSVGPVPTPPIVWPRWVFNDIDVAAAANSANKYFFAMQVDGVPTHSTIWSHGADARTIFPRKDVPAASCAG